MDGLDRKNGYFGAIAETMPFYGRRDRLNHSFIQAIRHAYQNSVTMCEKMAYGGIAPEEIRTIDDLPKVPIANKDKLINIQRALPLFGGLLAVLIEELEYIYFSPRPIFDPHKPDAYAHSGTVLYAAGFRENDTVLNTLSYHITRSAIRSVP